ncbi:MAG: DnaJ domain-containing protein [Deltaproteobacteria bacterium]|nr:DnaJ domain-containing protein [Deltaproteobacteria bacterium]
MLSQLSTPEIMAACGLIFGPGNNFSNDFLKQLQPAELKTIYRRKALETHPDRAKAMGRDEAEMTELFKEVSLAYELLRTAIDNDEVIIQNVRPKSPPRRKPPASKPTPQREWRDHSYFGPLPHRELLIGQFLYYSGFISWRALIEAITWQRRQRPLIGQLARDWGLLLPQDIQFILSNRGSGEKFGDCAKRLGYLSTFNILCLLGKQRRLNQPIGSFFIDRGLLTPQQMEELARKQIRHNQNIQVGRWRF